MPKISLTDFVDYSLATGPSQLVKVRELKRREAYEPAHDYWKQIREWLTDHEKGVLSLRDVGKLADAVTPGKRENYGEVLRGFKKFVRKRPGSPTKRAAAEEWKHAGLVVRVNPELCYRTPQGKLCVKMYFKAEPVTKHQAEATLLLMSEALPAYAPALLSARSGKLTRSNLTKTELDVYLRAQATAFMEMWKAIE